MAMCVCNTMTNQLTLFRVTITVERGNYAYNKYLSVTAVFNGSRRSVSISSSWTTLTAAHTTSSQPQMVGSVTNELLRNYFFFFFFSSSFFFLLLLLFFLVFLFFFLLLLLIFFLFFSSPPPPPSSSPPPPFLILNDAGLHSNSLPCFSVHSHPIKSWIFIFPRSSLTSPSHLKPLSTNPSYCNWSLLYYSFHHPFFMCSLQHA